VTLFEKELGVELFDGNSGKIELTKAGRLLKPEANASHTNTECPLDWRGLGQCSNMDRLL